jgi:hypothetical protein
MEPQAVFAESLLQRVHYAGCVFLELEGYDEVVCVPDQMSATSRPRLQLASKPFVHHLVQVDVRQQRRYHPALQCAGFRAADLPFLHHARVQPLADGRSNTPSRTHRRRMSTGRILAPTPQLGTGASPGHSAQTKLRFSPGLMGTVVHCAFSRIPHRAVQSPNRPLRLPNDWRLRDPREFYMGMA